MSGEVAAPAAPVPSNGTAAPTKPAPGVTTPTPTPKNGEGAVATAPSAGEATQTPKPKNPWGDGSLKVPIKFKGKEEFAEVNSLDDFARLAQRAKLSDESSKRAAEAERKLQAIIDAAQKDKLAYLKAAGIDPEAFVLEQAQEMLKRQEMTAEQRQVAQAQAEAKAARDEAVRIKAEWEKLQQERALDAQWQEEGPQWEAALKTRNRIGDKAYIEIASKIADFLTSNGIEATPEQICAEADEQWNKQALGIVEASPQKALEALAPKLDPAAALQILGPRLTPELLWGALQSDEARRQIMSLGLAWHKGTKTPTPKPATTTSTQARNTKGQYRTESEWRAEREKQK